jgi:hypothetical protein
MHRGNRYVASLFLTAAFMAPISAFATPVPQVDQRHEEHERRVYDPYHKDYHNWDRREDDVYRHWLGDRHEAYVDYEHLKHKDQRAYWNWRHEHEEHEHH